MKSFNCYNKKEIYIVHSQSTRGCTAISTGSEVFEFCEGNTLNHTDATDHFCNWFCKLVGSYSSDIQVAMDIKEKP